VAFEGACVSVFADGAGLLGEDNDVESAASKVGHEDRGPRRFDRRGRGDRRRCCHRRHHRHRCCRCRHLTRHGGKGRGQRGRPPSVVIVVIGSGGGSAVPDPAAAERETLDHRAVPPRPLRNDLSSSPSLSSRPRPPHYLHLPPPTLVNCQMPPSDAANDCRATTSSSTDVDDVALRRHHRSHIFLASASTPPCIPSAPPSLVDC
jgi:hypothetical protein